MIVARYTYTEQHAIDASRQLMRSIMPWVPLAPYIGLLMIAGMTYGWVVKGSAPWEGVNPLLVGPLLCLLPWFSRRQVRKVFRGSPEAGLEHVWRIDDTSLTFESKGSTARFEWSKLVRVKETKKGFLLFPQPRLAYWVPCSAFSSPSEIDVFRDYIRRSPIPKKG
jgi:hypothetical protein